MADLMDTFVGFMCARTTVLMWVGRADCGACAAGLCRVSSALWEMLADWGDLGVVGCVNPGGTSGTSRVHHINKIGCIMQILEQEEKRTRDKMFSNIVTRDETGMYFNTPELKCQYI